MAVDNSLAWLAQKFKKVGLKVVYAALLLVYAYKRSDTPRWAKNIVLGALAYLVSPIDSIPDLTPFLGYSDDFGVIILSLGAIASYINEDVRHNARRRLDSWFPEYDEAIIIEVEERINT